jgi:hypothetical protein
MAKQLVYGWLAELPRPSVKRDTGDEIEMFYQPKERLPIYSKALHSLEFSGTILARVPFVSRWMEREFTTFTRQTLVNHNWQD